jgi:hypothetical protein
MPASLRSRSDIGEVKTDRPGRPGSPAANGRNTAPDSGVWFSVAGRACEIAGIVPLPGAPLRSVFGSADWPGVTSP